MARGDIPDVIGIGVTVGFYSGMKNDAVTSAGMAVQSNWFSFFDTRLSPWLILDQGLDLHRFLIFRWRSMVLIQTIVI